MKNLTLIMLIFVAATFKCLAQANYLEKGNAFLDNDQLTKAEQTFRDGIKADPTNLIYQCQLGLTLIQQKKYAAAEIVLHQVLKTDSNNVAARWYSGIGYFENAQDRKSVNEFLKALPLIDKQSGQYYSANWYIGKCYANLLKTEGLTYAEADKMFASYQEYIRLQPDAEDAAEIKAYIERKKTRRAPSNVKIWIEL